MKTKILQKTVVAPILVLTSLLLLGTSQSQAQGVLGTYELSFCADGVPIGSTLFVGQELALHAYVADSSGTPASSGSVVFQVCTRGGRAIPNDPQPSSACDVDHTASWASLAFPRLTVDGTTCLGCLPAGPGNACLGYGVVQSPRTVGFRFKYFGQGSGIANGIATKDASWILP
jgi:hypothetical protein